MWLLFLLELAVKKPNGDINIFSFCTSHESESHIFFGCFFTKEVQGIFGLSLNHKFNHFNILTSKFLGLNKYCNLF